MAGKAGAEIAVPIKRQPHNHRPKSAAQRLNEHVLALTKELDLDKKQQAGVRDILIKERVAILDLRKGSGPGARDVVAAQQAIVTHTREQIRDLLNAEQRKKFFVDAPQDQLGPAQADVNYWLEKTRPKPAGAGGAAAPQSTAAPSEIGAPMATPPVDAPAPAPAH